MYTVELCGPKGMAHPGDSERLSVLAIYHMISELFARNWLSTELKCPRLVTFRKQCCIWLIDCPLVAHATTRLQMVFMARRGTYFSRQPAATGVQRKQNTMHKHHHTEAPQHSTSVETGSFASKGDMPSVRCFRSEHFRQSVSVLASTVVAVWHGHETFFRRG